MKKTYSISLFAAGLFLVAVVSGCGTFGGLFTATPQVQTYYEPHQTIQQVTNPDGSVGTITNTVMVPRQVTNGMTYTVSSGAQNLISGAQTVSSLLPPPYGTAATAGLGVLSGLLGVIATIKSRNLNSVQSVANLVEPMIAGVEAGGDPATKQAIQSYAAGAGVQTDLHPLVQKVTNQMAAPNPPAPTSN
jgi:hypothetical protein